MKVRVYFEGREGAGKVLGPTGTKIYDGVKVKWGKAKVGNVDRMVTEPIETETAEVIMDRAPAYKIVPSKGPKN